MVLSESEAEEEEEETESNESCGLFSFSIDLVSNGD